MATKKKKQSYGKGYVPKSELKSHEQMYPGHQAAAKKAGVSGLNAFGGRHKDFIAGNKARMQSMGITPSHKDSQGNLTGRYSAQDWRRMQNRPATRTHGTAGQPMTPNMVAAHQADVGARSFMRPGAAASRAAAGQYSPQLRQRPVHPDHGLSGVAPNAGQRYTGPSASDTRARIGQYSPQLRRRPTNLLPPTVRERRADTSRMPGVSAPYLYGNTPQMNVSRMPRVSSPYLYGNVPQSPRGYPIPQMTSVNPMMQSMVNARRQMPGEATRSTINRVIGDGSRILGHSVFPDFPSGYEMTDMSPGDLIGIAAPRDQNLQQGPPLRYPAGRNMFNPNMRMSGFNTRSPSRPGMSGVTPQEDYRSRFTGGLPGLLGRLYY
jgi:hypothetical protein